jgi:predicted amidohydrolase
VGLAQIASTADKNKNLDLVAAAVETAVRDGAEVVVLPEFAMYHLPLPDRTYVEQAEPLDGPFVRTVHEIACNHDVTVVYGTLEEVDGQRASNTLVVTSPHQRLQAVYRKMHLYEAFGAQESALIVPASDLTPVLFEVDDIRFGLNTCYDLRFPEVARRLVDAGAEVIVLPAAWAPGPRKEDHWSTLVRARAIENTVYYVAVGQAPPASVGNSMCVDPMGVAITQLGEAACTVVVEIQRSRVEDVRSINPCLADRRFSVQVGRPRT